MNSTQISLFGVFLLLQLKTRFEKQKSKKEILIFSHWLMQ